MKNEAGNDRAQPRSAANRRQTAISKITAPNVSNAIPRERLFHLLNGVLERPVIWIAAPAGSGKTTLVKSWLDAEGFRVLWYQVDQSDGDAASFFHYLALAAKKAAPRARRPLPVLTPEYLSGIEAFARRYFENLAGRLPASAVLVFDNFQDAPEESPFADVLCAGLSALPEGVRTIIISRGSAPAAFARLQAGGKVAAVGREEIRFTPDETRELLRLRGIENPREEVVRNMQVMTEGWAAGLVLMTETARQGGGAPFLPEHAAREDVFAYFAGEIFEKTDDDTRELLLCTSFPPVVSVPLALALTGNAAAESVLEGLYQRNYFIVRHEQDPPVYQYHPLFREFLMERAQARYGPDVVGGIQRAAAAHLEEGGRTDAAAGLYFDAQDWGNLARLVVRHAGALTAQGRGKTLERWLYAMPGEVALRDPWLVYWQGICRMPFDLRESRLRLEQAYGLFKERNDAPGLYLSWSGIVETYVYAWSDFHPLDHWISEIETLLRTNPEIPAPEIEARVASAVFCGLMYRQPHHPDLPRWEARLGAIIDSAADIHLKLTVGSHLVFYYTWWNGDQAKAALLVNALRHAVASSEISPLSRIVWRAIEAACAWMTGDNAACLEAASDGLRIAGETGVHLWDFMLLAQASFGTLTAGDLDAAAAVHRKMAFITGTGRKLDIAHYHFHLGWEALCRRDLPLALEHMEKGLRTAEETGEPFIGAFIRMAVAEVLIELGECERPKELLERSRRAGRSMRSNTVEYQYLWVEALRCLACGDEEGGLRNLAGHLAVSRQYGILNHAAWRESVMAPLYARALGAGIEVEQVRMLIRKRRIAPPDANAVNGTGTAEGEERRAGGRRPVPCPASSFCRVENWPWQVRVRALGGFTLEKDGNILQFGTRPPRRPLALLKLLASRGGKAVAELELTDALWPDAEGDAAHSAFTTTLQRLRRLIGEQTVILRDGKLSLDGSRCWVDAWEFERMLEAAGCGAKHAEPARRGAEGNGGRSAIEKALALYAGDFLSGEDRFAWALPYRETLRMRFLSCLQKLAASWERAGNWKAALEVYRRGLDRDELAEELYQGMLKCCGKLGLRAEGVAAYKRCAAALRARIGVDPSEETTALYASLLRK